MGNTIPNIKCDCGKVIQAWRYVQKPGDRVTCPRCGRRTYTLFKAGKDIKVGGNGIVIL